MNSLFASFICLFIRNKKRKQFLYDFLTKRIGKDAEKEVIDALYSDQNTKNIDGTLFLNRLNDRTNDLKKAISNVDNRMAALKIHQDLMFMTLYKGKEESLLEAKKRFFLNLPPAEGMMRKAQLVELYILKELHSICEKHGLNYFLSFGTLLGAVRHKGFIPWDDDIDVIMIRQDLEKLIDILKENDRLYIDQNYYIDRFNVGYFYKFKLKNIDIPLFVDIFVVDSFSGSEKEVAKNICREQRQMFREVTDAKIGNYPGEKKYRAVDEVFKRHKKKLNERFAIGDENGEYLIWSFDNFAKDDFYIGRKSEVLPPKKLEFEGMHFNVPSNYIEILDRFYGDIYTLPMDIVSKKHYKLSEIHKNNIEKLYKNSIDINKS